LRYDPDLPKRLPVDDYWLFEVKTSELTEFLFQQGMDASRPNWLGVTALHHFAMKGDIGRAAIYLDEGADLNARDEDICSTPLGWAAKFGRAEMVSYLLSRGAAPRLPDDPPWAAPIAWAKRRGHRDVVELLER
jgi:ankyrin repeat protein